MTELGELLRAQQLFLMRRVLSYAKRYEFTKYTSTLEEAWAASVKGLSDALTAAFESMPEPPELRVDQDFQSSPVCAFGILEARRHRERGITLVMFLSLMKYYRRAYLDLFEEAVADEEKRAEYRQWTERFFDQNEIAFCGEWDGRSATESLRELQEKNRELTNSKNQCVTVFESIPVPILLLDFADRCVNMNFAAQRLLLKDMVSSGYTYYEQPGFTADELMPFLRAELDSFSQGGGQETEFEKELETEQGKRIFHVRLQRMLDVSGKFAGKVIMFFDITERVKMEEQLRFVSYHDNLTGLYNRAFLDREVSLMETGMFDPVGVISCDVDCLKLVNDTLGHQAGDVLITVSGGILRECFRPQDILIRSGGDEFLAVLPNADELAVLEICGRLREKVRAHNEANETKPVSLSIGFATGRISAGDEMEQIIRQADERMYAEKENGRRLYRELFRRRMREHGRDLFR